MSTNWAYEKHLEFEAVVGKFSHGLRTIEQVTLLGIQYMRHVYRYSTTGVEELDGMVAWPVCYEHGDTLLNSLRALPNKLEFV